MRLDKFRGWGSWLAYASPCCLVLAFVALGVANTTVPAGAKAPNLPASFYALVVIALVLLGLWMVTMLAVAIDLEWIEHPLTHTGMTYVALGGAALATLAFLVLLLSSFGRTPDLLAFLVGLCWFGGLGVYLVVINVVGRRAGVLRGGLPWVGMVTGAVFLVGLFLLLVLPEALGFPIFVGLPLYVIWSVWLGFGLRRKAPAPAPAAAGQPA